MHPKFPELLFALVITLITSMAYVPAAHAVNLNSSAPGICQSRYANPGIFLTSGVANTGTTDPLYLVCTVARSPLPSGATTGSFYVDGTNNPGGTTNCAIFSYNYTGETLGAASFTATNSYDMLLTLPAAQLSTWAYVILECSIPPGGVLYGVTSLQ
jgi:hypothetical protein